MIRTHPARSAERVIPPQALRWLITPECFSETESFHDVPKPAFIGGLWFFSTRLFEDWECRFSRAALWVRLSLFRSTRTSTRKGLRLPRIFKDLAVPLSLLSCWKY
jgi:hypothetical protein